MPREIHLNGLVADDDRDTVELFDKTYRLRPVTRSIERVLLGVQASLQELPDKSSADDADQGALLDEMVGLLIDGIDALLEIDGAHRTSAKKLLTEKWDKDQVTSDQIQGYFTQLQEDEAEARPT